MPGFVKVTWLPKSTGIVYRDQPTRIKAREKRVHEYFYGPRNELQPITFDIKFSDIDGKIFKIGACQLEGVSSLTIFKKKNILPYLHSSHLLNKRKN